LIILLTSHSAFAQKLPKTQTASVWAPDNIKIDGKIEEWKGGFRAHYEPNHIYYTLSNDDKNLYLTVQMDDETGGRKIMDGGLTFTIVPFAKNADKISISFPVIPKNNQYLQEINGSPLLRYHRLKTSASSSQAEIDSLVARANRNYLWKNYQQMRVRGIIGISDPLLDINNTHGILAGASFDNEMRYTYELAIPLKYLEASISNVKSIRYNVTLNARPPVEVKPDNNLMSTKPHAVILGSDKIDMDFLFLESDTNFSGAYTLAAKP